MVPKTGAKIRPKTSRGRSQSDPEKVSKIDHSPGAQERGRGGSMGEGVGGGGGDLLRPAGPGQLGFAS